MMKIGKVFNLIIIIIFLWQSVGTCDSAGNSTVRPPLQGSLAGEARTEIDIEIILSRIERLMMLGTQESIVEVDLLEMQLLYSIGLLRRNTRIFNILSGVSLFPGLYVDEMWTSDNAFSEKTIKDGFYKYWEKIKQDLHIPLADIFPPLEGLSQIHHDSSNVLTEEFIQRWTSQMRPGDVVFLKMSLEYLLHYGASSDQVRSWVNRLAERIPSGVSLVIFETDLLRGTAIFKEALYPKRVATHLLQTGLFEDHANNLLSPAHRRRLDQINNRMDDRVVDRHALRLGEGFPAMAIGGKLSILRKTSSTIDLSSEVESKTAPDQPLLASMETVGEGEVDFLVMIKEKFASVIESGVPLQILDVGTGKKPDFCYRIKALLQENNIPAQIFGMQPDTNPFERIEPETIHEASMKGILLEIVRLEEFTPDKLVFAKHVKFHLIFITAPYFYISEEMLNNIKTALAPNSFLIITFWAKDPDAWEMQIDDYMKLIPAWFNVDITVRRLIGLPTSDMFPDLTPALIVSFKSDKETPMGEKIGHPRKTLSQL